MKRASSVAAAFVLLPLFGCPPAPEPTPVPPYPLDDVLRVHHIQMVGTHNSYHVQPASELVEDWNYTHAPLDVQLGEQGVRQFELDIWWDNGLAAFAVVHAPGLDDGTTCASLALCLGVMRQWSDAHPGHHPLLLLIEPKDGVDDEEEAAYVQDIEDELVAVWPMERLITPDDVQGDSASPREGLAERGWPTLGESRGKLIVQLHAGELADAYAGQQGDLAGRAMHVATNPSSPLASFLAMNDPVGGFAAIEAAVSAGLLVRTRADASRSDFEDGDLSRFEAARDSGAQALSTDHPTPDDETGYSVTIEGGTPSGCNPVTAPPECTTEAIEDPDRLSLPAE